VRAEIFVADGLREEYNRGSEGSPPGSDSINLADWLTFTPDRREFGLDAVGRRWALFLGSVNDRDKWPGGLKAAPMATQADVRRIALSLPDTEEAADRFAFSVRNKGKLKGFVWVWMERIEPKKPRVPQPDVIAVRVASLAEKDRILDLDPTKFFSEPHYNGFPAVLVNLPTITVRELEPLIREAWRCQAPKDLKS
jgi:hypothetical protein